MTPDLHPREARLAAKQKLDGELTAARTALVKLRAERDQITIGLRKGELLQKYTAKVQLGFLLTGLRQRLMSFSYALAPRLAGKSEHEISQMLDAEMRAALKDVAAWPERMANPNWSENIDTDLMPAPEGAGNGDGGADVVARLERINARRRQKYSKAKES